MLSASDILHGKILIVDDQRVNVLLLEQMLGGAGRFHPLAPASGSAAPTDLFRAACREAIPGIGDIPHVSAPIIVKYATDLGLFGLL